jgi:hypothetical protein
METHNPFYVLGAVIAIIFMIVMLISVLILIISYWMIYDKAGQPGWAILIPVYSLIVLFKIVGRPWSWLFWYLQLFPFYILMFLYPSEITALLLFLSGVASLVFAVITTNSLSKSFGKNAGFTVGLLLLPIVFYPILAFGNAKYIGPGGVAPGEDDDVLL